ncbi:MAG: class I SAM-dependent methyltransferase [Pseudomonadota bacterium]|nr:class I SAM-dependent methyltransferase [Pseudomonadota bacterium]
MDETEAPDDTAKAIWNGVAGQNWVEAQSLLDGMFQGFEDRLAADCAEQGARYVLDVGCGTGATTLAIARRSDEAGTSTGIDISQPMITLARERAARAGAKADFICADAEDYPLDTGRYDRIVSRFGVMFFADPVRAFTNLRRATRRGGQLGVIAWRAPEENPFMTAAERAARPFLPQTQEAPLPPTGQFAFADAGRVRAILDESGWSQVRIEPLDIVCTLPETQLETWFTRLGPLGRILPGLGDASRAAVLDAVRQGYAPFIAGGTVRFTAACWMIGGVNE